MSKARELADLLDANGDVQVTALDTQPQLGRRNLIINGNFDVWQRGASGASSGYFYMADRWMSYGYNGANTTYSQQAFTVGQTEVSGSPKYFARSTNTNGVIGRPYFEQRIEDIGRMSGQTVTVSFWVKSPDYSSHIRIGFYRYYGDSSAESSSDFTVGTASNTWQKIEYTYTIPNLTGKTIGVTSYLGFSIKTNSPAVCSLDLAQVQLELGSVATPFEQRSYGEELALCQRYFCKSNPQSQGLPTLVGTDIYYNNGGSMCVDCEDFSPCSVMFPVTMRTTPSIVTGHLKSYNGTLYKTITSVSAVDTGIKLLTHDAGNTGTIYQLGRPYKFAWYADAEL